MEFEVFSSKHLSLTVTGSTTISSYVADCTSYGPQAYYGSHSFIAVNKTILILAIGNSYVTAKKFK